jgi:glutamate-1-semialdehyde 2,1-aminomutase
MLPDLVAHAELHPMAMKAKGAQIFDVDNHGYIDYTAGGGAAIVGYANQYLLDAVRKVLTNGVPEGLHVPQEVELAESLGQFVPWVGTWCFTRHTDDALRLALALVHRMTGKQLVLTLDGSARCCAETSVLRIEGTPAGVDQLPADTWTLVREVPGWDLDRIEAALSAGASKLAAVCIDPLMTRFGVVPPPAGVLARVAEVCRDHGIMVIANEVVSGLRLDRGGVAAWSGMVPDVAVYGGPLGGGFPLGALALHREVDAGVLAELGPLPVPHPVALAAAEAILSILKNDSVYTRLAERTEQLLSGIEALANRFARPMRLNRMGSVFALYMAREPVVDKASFDRADAAAYRRFASAMMREGVLLPQAPSSTAFLSHAHSGKDVDETLAVCERVLLKHYQEDMP